MNRRIIPTSQKALYDNFHFAPGVVDGQNLRCSGVIGMNPDGSVPKDPEVQFTLAFEAIGEVLSEAGAEFSDITEMTTFHIAMHEHMGVFSRVRSSFIKEPYPAWTAVGTTELALPGALVEIRVTARMPD
ncbi:MAG TPA: RidA family protein [Myxococcales bacterium]|nr:RidA family protein [Myxococcales bacterium]HIL80054.1 RidA family protein [Myxococcales bacterium]